ncbi:MAG: hypothetical protein WBX03_04045 [Terriglobales bacterium]|jgi:hypothetical protein
MLAAQPYCSAAQDQQSPQNSPVESQDQSRPQTHAAAPNDGVCWLYAALQRPDWWLVIIAAATGIAIAVQAGEMKNATSVMQGQMTEMQKARELANKTLTLQYRPRIIVRRAKVVQFSTLLNQPQECEIRFTLINSGGSPAHIAAGANIKLVSCIAHDIGNMEFKEGDPLLFKQFTLQAGQEVICEETLSTGVVFDLEWETFRRGIRTSPLRYLFLMGTIYYTDDLDIPRSTGLNRTYDVKTQAFIPGKDEDEEYAD